MGAAAAAAVDANGGGALQCTVRSLAPDLADALSDALLDNGAASAAWVLVVHRILISTENGCLLLNWHRMSRMRCQMRCWTAAPHPQCEC